MFLCRCRCGSEGRGQHHHGREAAQFAGHLLVQPDVLETRTVVDAVDHLGHPLHPRLIAHRGARVEEDRPDVVLDQLPFDLPYLCLPIIPSEHSADGDRRAK